MNKIICVFILISTLITISCSNEKQSNVNNEKKITKVRYTLIPQNIYRADSITKSLETADANQRAESRRLFMTGLDLLANKNDAAASIEYFKEAIFYYPDEKNYRYLFEAYLKNNNLDLADSVNIALEGRIEYSETTFNSALISAAKRDTSMCINLLRAAAEEGFIFRERIVNEKLFAFVENNMSFQSILVTYFGNDAKLTKILFTAFIKTFPDLELPFEMKQDSAKSFNFDSYINYDFAAFIPDIRSSEFSRDVGNEYMYVGKFKTENGIAIIYKDYEIIADTLNPVTTNIIVYDTLGKIISSQAIGCFCSPLESKGFVVNKNLTIDIITYKTKWEIDPLEKGYAGNKIVAVEPKELDTFIISKENTLVKLEKKEDVASSSQ